MKRILVIGRPKVHLVDEGNQTLCGWVFLPSRIQTIDPRLYANWTCKKCARKENA